MQTKESQVQPSGDIPKKYEKISTLISTPLSPLFLHVHTFPITLYLLFSCPKVKKCNLHLFPLTISFHYTGGAQVSGYKYKYSFVGTYTDSMQQTVIGDESIEKNPPQFPIRLPFSSMCASK